MIDRYLGIFFNYTIIPSILIFLSVYKWWAMDNYPCVGLLSHKFGKWKVIEFKDEKPENICRYQVRQCEQCGFSVKKSL